MSVALLRSGRHVSPPYKMNGPPRKTTRSEMTELIQLASVFSLLSLSLLNVSHTWEYQHQPQKKWPTLKASRRETKGRNLLFCSDHQTITLRMGPRAKVRFKRAQENQRSAPYVQGYWVSVDSVVGAPYAENTSFAGYSPDPFSNETKGWHAGAKSLADLKIFKKRRFLLSKNVGWLF
ncbi:hypothetical protein B0O99DRAFT_238030 [Bisporella sp. PMI_857]|nr:hypothetical protein B0O99DRAFT_238030 [Bisporella sp. PMI_857]